MSRQLYKSYTGGIGGYKPYYPIPKFQTTPEQLLTPPKTQHSLAQAPEDELCPKLFSMLAQDYSLSGISIDNIQYFGKKEIETISFRILNGIPEIISALTEAKIPFTPMAGGNNFWIIIQADDIEAYFIRRKSI